MKLSLYLKTTDCLPFSDMVFDTSGIRLPPLTSRVNMHTLNLKTLSKTFISKKSEFKKLEQGKAEERRLTAHQNLLKSAREAYSACQWRYLAIDVESWEQNHEYITELGISIFDSSSWGTSTPPRTSTSTSMATHRAEEEEEEEEEEEGDLERVLGRGVETRHFRVMEHLGLRNGRYVPDNADKFRYGTSERMTLSVLSETINVLLKSASGLRTAVVFHDAGADLRYLSSIGVVVPASIPVWDTKTLYAAHTRAKKGMEKGLGKMIDELGITVFALHNAGNDAYATMLAFRAICEGDRERRIDGNTGGKVDTIVVAWDSD